MLGSLVMLLWISPLMAALALASVCVMGVVAARPLKNLENIAREHNVLYGQLMGTVTEAIASIRVVKGYQKEGRLDEVFSGGATRLLESARRMLAVTARIELGTMLTFVG
jgi:subfamily B ATP-binding cassette protein MsbA